MKAPKDNSAAIARADEQQRQEKIRQGTEAINNTFDSQFNDEFFNNRQNAFLNFAKPQLNDQFADAQRKLAFTLDRSGTLNSSVRAEREAELQKLYETNRRSVADQALSFGTTARNNVEEARADLIRTLNANADVQGATNSAIARAQALSAPDNFSPLGQLFTTFTNTLGTQAGLERAAALSGGSIQPQYNTGLFGPRRNAVQVT